jgi:hypothetical protein
MMTYYQIKAVKDATICLLYVPFLVHIWFFFRFHPSLHDSIPFHQGHRCISGLHFINK